MDRNDWGAVLRGTDWALLRAQKETLVSLTTRKETKPGEPVVAVISAEEMERLLGLLHFIDSVQDAAALEADESSVFGEPRGT